VAKTLPAARPALEPASRRPRLGRLAARVAELPDAWLALAAAAFVLAVDQLWGLTGVSDGSLAYGLADDPAHLVTAALALVWLRSVIRTPLSAPFVLAALGASVAIEVDHIPGYLGSHLLTGSLPRPYTHSMLLVFAPVAIGLASRRRAISELSLGIGCGVAAHLLRDLATGPGAPLFWPISGATERVPYAVFAGVLASGALSVAAAGRSHGGRRTAAGTAAGR
jgi:inner membrane protein